MPAVTTDTLGAVLSQASTRLADSDSPRLDAEVLLGHVLGCSRAQLLSRSDQALQAEHARRFRDLVAQRCSGMPIAYLTGGREFWSLALSVNEHTLIPRPDTECLVEQALALIRQHGYRHILDLGTGSGAIALALAAECRHCQVLATDISPQATAVARGNSERLGLGNLRFLTGDWFQPLGTAQFDLIVANPPYLAAGDPHLRRGDLRFEPRAALVSGADGLDALRHIVRQAPGHLRTGGALLVEHGCEQAASIAALLRERGYQQIRTRKDYASHDRATGGYWQAC